MLGGLMAARMVAVIQRDGQRDEVVVEEPLEIRVDGLALSVTMRAPDLDGHLPARGPAKAA
jgi:formate dehydrogenase assembly factor FdhD